MVERLFWEDSYLQECKAKVVSIDKNIISVDKTIIYANSGGQISDSATINGIQVINAAITSEYDIEYELEETPNFAIGDFVEIKINWDKRYKLMKLHSAQHLVADFFEREVETFELTGSNVKESKATLTYAYPENVNSILEKIEPLVNQFFLENHSITITSDEHDNNKRIWSCGNFTCFCGGTHVKFTREIGQIKLKRKNPGAGKETIEILLIEESRN